MLEIGVNIRLPGLGTDRLQLLRCQPIFLTHGDLSFRVRTSRLDHPIDELC
jgi:hypothetical protein